MYQIGFLGFGNMAKAIAQGVIGGGFLSEGDIAAYDPFPGAFASFGHRVGQCGSAAELAKNSRFLFLAVKPQAMDEALEAIRDAVRGDMVIVSIAAGVTAERIAGRTGTVCPVVRTMPNAPMLLGKGTTAIARPDGVSDADYDFLLGVFRHVGTVYEIPGDKFNEVIPVHGSSPAFICLFAKIIADCAERSGLSREDATAMFCDTLAGSAEMMQKSGMGPDELIGMVSSKGGTTAAALDEMQAFGFTKAVQMGFARCVERAYELGKL